MMRKIYTGVFLCTAIVLAVFLFIDSFEVTAYATNTSAYTAQEDDREFTERDEINRTYQLQPGARVEVSSINGPVEIETSDTNTAEVHIVRTARKREDFDRRRMIVEQTASGLVVRTEKARDMPKGVEVRERVRLKLPRRIDLAVASVNGRVKAGEIDGSIRLNSINGRVEVAGAAGHAEAHSINGSVALTLAKLNQQGVRMTSINGAIELRFKNDLDADLSVESINGSVTMDVPNVTMQSKSNKSNFRARVGAGGAPITLTSVNGSVRLMRA